jgi:D-alanyl-D-alanine carboxypeptidase (penicillin-binding protein 5/6)
MLDYAFSQYQTHPLFEKDHVLTKVKVSKGSEKDANLMTSEPISVLTKKGENVDDVTQEIVMKKDVQAPIKKGDELGSLQLKKDEKILAESKLVVEVI